MMKYLNPSIERTLLAQLSVRLASLVSLLASKIALLILLGMFLAACGGGGGGGGTSSLSPLASGARNTRVATALADNVAMAIPREGSVTQSSNIDNTGVTADDVDVTVSDSGDGLQVMVTNSRSGSNFSEIDSADESVELIRSFGGAFEEDALTIQSQELLLGKRVNDGLLFVNVLITNLADDNTNYIAAGIWLYAPSGDLDVNIGQAEFGAFMDAPDAYYTPNSYLMDAANPEATYNGDATGVYVEINNGEEYFSEFIATSQFVANFGPTPTIRGMISDVIELDDDREELGSLTDGPTMMFN